jgi:hypothetical protein
MLSVAPIMVLQSRMSDSPIKKVDPRRHFSANGDGQIVAG